jgi:hypothetical protein
MSPMPKPTLILELSFDDKEGTLRLLELLEAEGKVQVNIMRARLDERSAWMSLELQGAELRQVWDAAARLQEAACIKDASWKSSSQAS